MKEKMKEVLYVDGIGRNLVEGTSMLSLLRLPENVALKLSDLQRSIDAEYKALEEEFKDANPESVDYEKYQKVKKQRITPLINRGRDLEREAGLPDFLVITNHRKVQGIDNYQIGDILRE